MDWLLRSVGALILLAAAQDIFVTVLFPASGHGLIRRPTSRATWHVFRLIGKMTHGQRRRNLLAYGGPVQVAVTLTAWVVLLVAGWALIYKPALGTDIRSTSGPTDTSWASAFYFSGYALTTLGTGDIAPKSGLYRLLTVTEAMMGCATISMVITYFLTVYTNLTSRNAFAGFLHHRTRGTGDAAVLFAGLADGPDLFEARGFFSSLTRFILDVYETHRFFPVLRYFHYRYPYYSLPRIVLIALDSATLTRTALDGDRYRALIKSIGAQGLTEAALQLVCMLVPDASAHQPSRQLADAWRERYRRAVVRLREAGLRVNPDPAAGADDYVRLRGRWDAQVRALASAMLYEWDEIEPSLPRPPA
ncbi:potassium channel family protein [Planosporangium sp. 12N6]|uniref:potassium channel family protein n=1 Tax=Planosporangium spinosum TaxID=3402278 RepID=UPI003CEC8F51